MNRAELMELTRKANDGTAMAEQALSFCSTEASNGRGATYYWVASTPKEHTLNLIRMAGITVRFVEEDSYLHMVWDEAAENLRQEETLLRPPRATRGMGGVRRDEPESRPLAPRGTIDTPF